MRSNPQTRVLNEIKEKLDTSIQVTNNIGLIKDNLTSNKAAATEENIDETEKPMLLLISNGHEICVVDIKDNSSEYLKKIATLNLVDKQLPVGLFRLVVADLNGQLQAFNSYPTTNIIDLPSKCFHEVIGEGRFTMGEWFHEVIVEGTVDCEGRFTMEPPSSFFVKSHLVLGDLTFATIVDPISKHLVFDSTDSKWKVQDLKWKLLFPSTNPLMFTTVWDILTYGGKAICVDQIKFQNYFYYVVIALLIGKDDDDDDDSHSVYVVAYLVGSNGNIRARQTLYGFFNGPVQPFFVMTSAILKGGGTDGKTMCVALAAKAVIDDTKQTDEYFFFSNTFIVETVVNNLESNMNLILNTHKYFDMGRKLVHIDIKDSRVYKIFEKDCGYFGASTEVCFF